jgi:hypothetical protein
MQDIIHKAEVAWQSEPGRYLIDTQLTQGRGFVPQAIRVEPLLAVRRAERALHESSTIKAIEFTADDGFADTMPVDEPPHGSGAAPDEDVYIAPGWGASLLFGGTVGIAVSALVGSIWLAVQHWR